MNPRTNRSLLIAVGIAIMLVALTGIGLRFQFLPKPFVSAPIIQPHRTTDFGALSGEYGTESYQPAFNLKIGTTTPKGFWFSIETSYGAHICAFGEQDEFKFARLSGAHEASFQAPGNPNPNTGKETICGLKFDFLKPDTIIVKEANSWGCRAYCGVVGPGFENTYIKNLKPKEPDITMLVDDARFTKPLKDLIPERFRHLFTECATGHPEIEEKGNKALYMSGLPGLYTICGSLISVALPDHIWAIVLDPAPEKDGRLADKGSSSLYFTNVKVDANAPPPELEDWINSQAQGKMYCMNAPEKRCKNF